MQEQDIREFCQANSIFSMFSRKIPLLYPLIFWDNPKVRLAKPDELLDYINGLRARAGEDYLSKVRLQDIIRRLVERGHCSEGEYFLKKDEIRNFLLQGKPRMADKRRLWVWLKMAGLPQDTEI